LTTTAAQAQIAPHASHIVSDAANTVEVAPVRVALIVSTFGMGGLERCAANLLNELDRELFTPTLICLSRMGDAAQWIHAQDVEVVELDKRAGNDPSVVWRLARALRERQIDLVHSHNWGTLVETALARRWAGAKTHVHAEHGLELADLKLRRWKLFARRAAMRWALNRTDAVVVVAPSVREKLIERSGIRADKVSVVANGVELSGLEHADERAKKLRTSLGLEADDVLIGSVGRLAPVKNFRAAIDAIVELRRRQHPVHLAIVGDGPESDNLQAHVKSIDGEAFIHLVGQQADVAAWYAAMDIYVNSSVSEGMNLAILEAMAAGVPVVATDVGANRLLVATEPACGQVVPANQTSILADAIESLLAAPARRKIMSNAAREKHRCHYSTLAMTRRYADLYQQLVSRSSRAVGDGRCR
jgi:sugar transferase (PEP-CTERM/EpsH1 system associated)